MFSSRATERVEHECLTCRALGSNPSFSTVCVTLDRLLNLSGPQFPQFYNENKGSIYFSVVVTRGQRIDTRTEVKPVPRTW